VSDKYVQSVNSGLLVERRRTTKFAGENAELLCSGAPLEDLFKRISVVVSEAVNVLPMRIHVLFAPEALSTAASPDVSGDP
jgi:hypothetical protein